MTLETLAKDIAAAAEADVKALIDEAKAEAVVCGTSTAPGEGASLRGGGDLAMLLHLRTGMLLST